MSNQFLSDETCVQLGELLGTMERLSGVKPNTGMLNNIMNQPIVWITQFQLEIMSEEKYAVAVDEALKSVFAGIPVEYAKARMNGDGQGNFMLGYMRARAEQICDWAALRKRAGLSQVEAAKAAGITQATLSRIENGDAKPRRSTENKLLAVYGR